MVATCILVLSRDRVNRHPFEQKIDGLHGSGPRRASGASLTSFSLFIYYDQFQENLGPRFSQVLEEYHLAIDVGSVGCRIASRG